VLTIFAKLSSFPVARMWASRGAPAAARSTLRPDRPWVSASSASGSSSLRPAKTNGATGNERPLRGRANRHRLTLRVNAAFGGSRGEALLADPYRVLGVASDATQEEIKLAYRKRTKELHPDVNPSPDAADRFRRVNRAYAVLSDAPRRMVFDRGDDSNAAAEGFVPDAETRRRAEKTRYRVDANGGGARAVRDAEAHRDGPFVNGGQSKTSAASREAVSLYDEEVRRKGGRKMLLERIRRAWTVWCTAWFMTLTFAVPAGVAYWVVYGVAAETMGGGVKMLER